jgi:hypothetical protein
VVRRATFILVITGLVTALAMRPSRASDISVTAVVEPSVVSVGAEATLVVSVKGKFRKSSQPELPQIDGLTFYQAGSSQSFSIVNGQASSSLQFTYVLVAQREGRYTIEPIRFETGGNIYTAEPVVIDVVQSTSRAVPPPGASESRQEAGSDSPIFIRASADRDTVYVNEQVTWSMGFYTDGRLDLMRSPEYSPPPAEGFWAEDLPPQQNYYATINGKQYLVNEIKRGFFPTAPGQYRIGAARVEVVLNDASSFNFDDFFSRNLRSFGFGKPQTLATDEIPITVLALPERGKPADFSGLVGRDLTISLQADKQVVPAGDPVNVVLEVRGQGNFKTMAAPQIPNIPGFKVYESGASSELFKNDYVVSGRKRIEFVLVPQNEGRAVIPPVELSYFDPTAKAYRTIRSTALELDVQPGTKEEGRRVVFTGSGEDIAVLGRDIHFIHPVPALVSAGRADPYRSRLYLGAHAIPLLAVIASLVVARRRKRWMADAPLYRARSAAREAEKKLRHGRDLQARGQTNDAFAAISLGLRGYLADKMNKPAPGLTTEEISHFLREKSVPSAEIDRVGTILKTCDGARYSAAASSSDQAEQTREQASQIIALLEREYFA